MNVKRPREERYDVCQNYADISDTPSTVIFIFVKDAIISPNVLVKSNRLIFFLLSDIKAKYLLFSRSRRKCSKVKMLLVWFIKHGCNFQWMIKFKLFFKVNQLQFFYIVLLSLSKGIHIFYGLKEQPLVLYIGLYVLHIMAILYYNALNTQLNFTNHQA